MSLPKTTQDAEKLAPTSSDATLSNDTPYFLLSVKDTAAKFETNAEDGLSSSKVASLQARDGPNQLSGGGGVSWTSILAAQIFNAMILVLSEWENSLTMPSS